MLNNYTFLTDHSYSLRPVIDDNDKLSLNQHEEKSNKRRRSSNRTNKINQTTNRTASIDRNSSDKENNSLILSNSNDIPKTSINTRSNKKKSIPSRLSSRTSTTNSRTQTGKKHDNKTSTKIGIKSTQGSIVKKKKNFNQEKTKSLYISEIDTNDAPPSLSIEERVKLRRTKPLQISTIITEKNKNKSQIQTMINNSRKKTKIIKPKKNSTVSTIKTNKFFLGSGLDLDNIVLGNRQRRSVQT